jgi:hypothetical protein
VQVTPASKKAISVSADDLLAKAGIPESDSRYIEKQQAAQVFVDSLQFTTDPPAADLTNYIGKKIEVTARAERDGVDAVQKALGVEISGLDISKKVKVEENSEGTASASTGSSGSSGSGGASDRSSGSSGSGSSSGPEKSKKADSGTSGSGTSSKSADKKSSSDKDAGGKKYTASSIRTKTALLKAGQSAGKNAVTTATTSARTGKSVNKETFAGTSNRFTDPGIKPSSVYLGTASGGDDILVCVYKVEMYDNGVNKEDWVNTFEGAHFGGITEDTTEAQLRKGMKYDTYFYKDEGEAKLINWYEKKYGVKMEKIK